MSDVGILGAIVIGVLAGWIAEKLMKRDHGLLTNLLVGVVGSFIGAFLAERVFNLAYAGWWASLAVSTAGAILLLFLLGLIRRR